LQANLSKMDGVRSLVQALTERRIDILVSSAGSLTQRTRVLDSSEDLWQRVLTLNLTSASFLAKAVLAGMVERKMGFVVNVSSVAARNGGGLGAIPYQAAKGAVSTVTKGVAKEFSPFGIRINNQRGLAGHHRHQLSSDFSNDQMLSAIKAATPMARLGTAEEVADVILFLFSDEARFIQGQVIEANGGFM
jgi:3-oxoacyl-[acyl-carrier protein] reductase